MTKQKNTKQSLLSSVIALVLCFTMLIGTTLAWFTDEAINSANKVQAGTLKIDLLKGVGADDYDSIDDETNSLFDSTYWEPNQTRVVYLGIESKGNLDLKYYVDLIVSQPDGQTVDMTRVMQYTITPDAKYGDAVAWSDSNANGVTLGENLSVGEAVLAAGATHYFALAVHMDQDATNDYQGKELTFDIRVRAEQVGMESNSASVMEALQAADEKLYDESILDWVASLYDPGTGGFYYSSGARNSEGYLPDLESTYMGVYLMQTVQFIGNGANEDILPQDLRDGFVNFARERQAEDDGYFYDTQFAKNVTVAKRGRDYNWGKTLVSKFNGEFKYTLAEDRIATTMTAAANEEPVADHLTSEQKFLEYLNSLDWDTGAYGNGNTLAAQITQIKAAGLMDTAVQFFKEIQNPETGMWGTGDLSVNHTNAAMKISGFFTKETEPYPNIDKMMASFVTIYENLEMRYITDVYNPLVLVTQAKNSYEQLPAQIMGAVNEKLVEIINLTADRAVQFRKNDNGYGNDKAGGQEYSAGAKKGTGANESDIGATQIAFSLRHYLYDIAGVDLVPLFDDATRDAFIDNLMDNDPIIKQPIVLPDIAPTYDRPYDKNAIGFNETFDDIPAGYMPGAPWSRWPNSVGNFKTELDPTDPNNMVGSIAKDTDGLGIYWVDMKYGTSGGKQTVSFDIMLDSSTGSTLFENELGQQTFAFWYIDGADGETFDLKFSHDYKNKTTFFEDAEYDKWYTLKFVYDPETFITEYYVNGDLKASDLGYYGYENNAAAPGGVDRLKFSAQSACTVKLFIDNITMTVED